jgi:hypothetical protein
MEYILLLIVLLLYLLPGIIAGNRFHPQAVPIIIINIFLGWTLIGWVAALAWACSAIPAASPRPAAPLLAIEPAWTENPYRDGTPQAQEWEQQHAAH